MPLSAQIPESEPINMTPMIDVVFNLLIFFLLSAAYFNQEQSLELSVPKVAGVTPAVAPPSDIVINVQSNGQIKVADRIYSIDELATFLKRTKENFPAQGVAIRGDEDTRYQNIASVLALCKEVGIRGIDVMVQPERR